MSVSRLSSFLGATGAALLVVAALGGTALAEPTAADRTAADELYKSGRQLSSEGRFVEACPKFAQSQRLDPGVGTLLYLGECYEKTARLASAWNAFREAADLARVSQQAGREKVALERAATLEKRMPKLVVELDAGAGTVTGLVVKRDGADVLRDLFGTALPLDSGPHTVAASAPGHTPWTTTVDLTDGTVSRVKVPALAPVAPPAASSSPVVAPPASVTASAAPLPPPPPRPDAWPARRSWALAAGGVGLLGVGIGTGFGVSAISNWHDVTTGTGACTSRPNCTSGQKDSADKASHAATASTISFTVGLLGLGAGAVLWFWPADDRSATALRVGPGSVSFEGKW